MINNDDFPIIITKNFFKRNDSGKSQITNKQKQCHVLVEYQLGRANSNLTIALQWNKQTLMLMLKTFSRKLLLKHKLI